VFWKEQLTCTQTSKQTLAILEGMAVSMVGKGLLSNLKEPFLFEGRINIIPARLAACTRKGEILIERRKETKKMAKVNGDTIE
jgi:hypothetical protein